MKIAGYETHPAADLFPLMEGAELQTLADDIKAHGLHNPVVLFADGGKRLVLDGRNRLRACEMVGVAPTLEFWEGGGSPTEWVVSQNLHRRHLSTSQRAMVAAGLVALFEKEAHARQSAALKHGKAAPVTANLRERGTAAEKAAEAVNVSPRIVESAIKVAKEAPPEVVAAVVGGQMTVHAAEQTIAPVRPHHGAPGKCNEKTRGDMWRVPRSPAALATFLRKHWTTKEWRDFMSAARDAA